MVVFLKYAKEVSLVLHERMPLEGPLAHLSLPSSRQQDRIGLVEVCTDLISETVGCFHNSLLCIRHHFYSGRIYL